MNKKLFIVGNTKKLIKAFTNDTDARDYLQHLVHNLRHRHKQNIVKVHARRYMRVDDGIAFDIKTIEIGDLI